MRILNLSMKHFRNYEHEDVHFHNKVNIIIGNNAQGKTNLIEALYMMSIGKSFRTNRDHDMIMFEKENAHIKTKAVKENSEISIELFLNKNQKKIIKINGMKLKKNTDILDNIYMVVFSPEDLKIVKEGPEKRRDFINRELCQIKPIYYYNLYKYSKVLLQRNAFLKNFKNEKYDANLLDVWNKEIVEYGIHLIKERKQFIDKLNIISREIHSEITNGKENIELFYECNAYKNINEAIEKAEYIKKLDENIKTDFFRGNTGIGPHKDDISIKVNGKDVRYYGSQGQQRTASLSLKLAEIKLIYEETGEMPILLLDDVLSELDVFRQKFLIKSLKDIQLFITTTEISDFLKESLPDNYIFEISKGKVANIDKR